LEAFQFERPDQSCAYSSVVLREIMFHN
jgi:hypothetical protein